MTQAFVAIPFLGLMLPEPIPVEEKEYNIDLKWRPGETREERGFTRVSNDWFIWDFGCGETQIFMASSAKMTWNIRCGSLWRPGGLFQGTVEEAKAEAQRFTREILQKCVIAVEKVVFAIKRGDS